MFGAHGIKFGLEIQVENNLNIGSLICFVHVKDVIDRMENMFCKAVIIFLGLHFILFYPNLMDLRPLIAAIAVCI